MRVIYSRHKLSAHLIFRYLEDRALRKDKSGMWQCLLTASVLVFEEFLQEAAKRHNEDQNMENQLEYHAQFLLIQFNNNLREVRRVADIFLAKLIDAFPFLLWNGTVISTALQLMQSLIKNIEEDPDCKVAVLTMQGLPWQIHLQVRFLKFLIIKFEYLGFVGTSKSDRQRFFETLRANSLRGC